MVGSSNKSICMYWKGFYSALDVTTGGLMLFQHHMAPSNFAPVHDLAPVLSLNQLRSKESISHRQQSIFFQRVQNSLSMSFMIYLALYGSDLNLGGPWFSENPNSKVESIRSFLFEKFVGPERSSDFASAIDAPQDVGGLVAAEQLNWRHMGFVHQDDIWKTQIHALYEITFSFGTSHKKLFGTPFYIILWDHLCTQQFGSSFEASKSSISGRHQRDILTLQAVNHSFWQPGWLRPCSHARTPV